MFQYKLVFKRVVSDGEVKMAGWNSTCGGLAEQNPTEQDMWEALKYTLTDSIKISTYKFAFLQSILDCCIRHNSLTISFDELFYRFSEIYWEFILKYDLPQIRKNKRYQESLVETVIRSEIARGDYSDEVSFAQLPEDVRKRIADNIIRYAPKNVVGAFHNDTSGLFFSFSQDAKEIALSTTSKTFLSHYRELIRMLNDVFWIEMIGELNEGILPDELRIKNEINCLKMSEPPFESLILRYFADIIRVPSHDATGLPRIRRNHDMLDAIDRFIEEANVILNNSLISYTKYSSYIQAELEGITQNGNFRNILVQARVKSPSSLAEKVYRKNYHSKYSTPSAFMDALPDIIGARIVCLLNTEEESLYEYLQAIYCESIEIDGNIYCCRSVPSGTDKLYLQLYGQPEIQKNGHEIYRIACKWYCSENDSYTNVELQIKSMVHYFWGELDHMLFYKNYSYLISSAFYSQYMNTVSTELKNIDRQLSILREQIKKTDDKAIKEIKQIASLLLYNKYHDTVEEKIKCTIDLREVFDLLVDLSFQNMTDISTIHQHFYDLISKAPNSRFRSDVIEIIQNGRLISAVFSPRELQFAITIDSVLKKKDIFWVFFAALYASHILRDSEQEYNTIIKRICGEFISMTNIFVDSIEQIYDDCEDVYDKYKEAVYTGIGMAFSMYQKIDFFLYDVNLNIINDLVDNIARKLQTKIASDTADLVTENLEVVSLFVECSILANVNDHVDTVRVSKLALCLQNEDVFGLSLNWDSYEELKTRSHLSGDEFIQIFASEGE